VVVVGLLIPLVLIGAAALAASLFVRRSSLLITEEGIEIRNYPQARRLIPLVRVDHFEATEPAGNFSSLRPKTGIVVLTDGSRVPVRVLAAPGAGVGIEALNRRVESLRRPT